ncbi:MAG: methylenetetrahydrofolate reductase [NAD(P)H] [Pseudomonadales bacterium]|jgi:methylenetetrahydrofolate reductase (NADPH)|nr:methylenetetrahydrofolate reductase [NAD(P)H] [Pseudomonadales bacterium]MDP6469472.1 methylenetetrahydrofolate reductase [NAD(P)H] [Pseudomonadales bacterium]MDP6827314.1 methylenetetrahydrofolate reductase [NAD(P)H] [Pseudomonadales bacterium]MDP6971137.1 methylenetetrahydrofolate reductase [NAD(P)H] [Pseudomonadales bacterium]|tara:strand:+ start:437 stop:1264 length:828 start_codon:yes stop_codon:yes gene_type:complete
MRISFEFFPPRAEGGMESLGRVVDRLAAFSPEFYSVTYGAGGSTRDGTLDTIRYLCGKSMNAAPHLSIGGDTPEQTAALLDAYDEMGVTRVVALRGDLPSGLGRSRFATNAEALVRRIRKHNGEHFHLEVAAYPEVHPDATSPESDLEFFRRKVQAGANSAITQYFYNAPAYYDFVARARAAGITVPIFPGIMPITNFEGIVRFSGNCGADVPRWIHKRLESLQHDKGALKAFGIEVVTRMCEDLLANGAPGLHFYTLNRWGATSRICENLGLGA